MTAHTWRICDHQQLRLIRPNQPLSTRCTYSPPCPQSPQWRQQVRLHHTTHGATDSSRAPPDGTSSRIATTAALLKERHGLRGLSRSASRSSVAIVADVIHTHRFQCRFGNLEAVNVVQLDQCLRVHNLLDRPPNKTLNMFMKGQGIYHWRPLLCETM